MKKINWKVRFKNPVFIVQLLLSVLMPILAYFGLTLEQLTTWGILLNALLDAVKNPYILGTIIISVWSTLNDPTTKGFISDSKQALSYKKPKKD